MRKYNYPVYEYEKENPPFVMCFNKTQDTKMAIVNTTENICACIMSDEHHLNDELEFWTTDGRFVLSTLSRFLNMVPDQNWVKNELQPTIVSMQLGEKEPPIVVYYKVNEMDGLGFYYPKGCKIQSEI